MNEGKDLFPHYNVLPKEVRDLVESFDEDKDLYSECKRLEKELKPHGYTFEWGLDGVPYNLRKINKTTEQIMKQEVTTFTYEIDPVSLTKELIQEKQDKRKAERKLIENRLSIIAPVVRELSKHLLALDREFKWKETFREGSILKDKKDRKSEQDVYNSFDFQKDGTYARILFSGSVGVRTEKGITVNPIALKVCAKEDLSGFFFLMDDAGQMARYEAIDKLLTAISVKIATICDEAMNYNKK